MVQAPRLTLWESGDLSWVGVLKKYVGVYLILFFLPCLLHGAVSANKVSGRRLRPERKAPRGPAKDLSRFSKAREKIPRRFLALTLEFSGQVQDSFTAVRNLAS